MQRWWLIPEEMPQNPTKTLSIELYPILQGLTEDMQH